MIQEHHLTAELFGQMMTICHLLHIQHRSVLLVFLGLRKVELKELTFQQTTLQDLKKNCQLRNVRKCMWTKTCCIFAQQYTQQETDMVNVCAALPSDTKPNHKRSLERHSTRVEIPGVNISPSRRMLIAATTWPERHWTQFFSAFSTIHLLLDHLKCMQMEE